mgnify:CR=1 FL=1
MHEATGNIWDAKAERTVITISAEYSGGPGSERAFLVSGIAAQAARRYPSLEEIIGTLLSLPTVGERVTAIPYDLIYFPVKSKERDNANLSRIELSALELVALTDKRDWAKVVLPRPGVGRGGLLWESVRPILAKILDDRFTCMTYQSKEIT